MSQFVWTCGCGWRSTSENSARGIRGHAPAACRRCGSTTLKVTSEKHPKVTNVCKDCRKDFIGWIGSKYCQRCMPKHRGSKIWDGVANTNGRQSGIRFSRTTTNTTRRNRRAVLSGWPKFAIIHRAQQLGLCRVKEKPWTKAEDAFLREHVGVRTPHWMAKQLRTRTVTAIVVRLKRMNISRRIQADGMTLGQLEQAIGIDHRQIVAWWKSGRLKGTYRNNPHEHERFEFQEQDIARFLIDNPSAFRLDRVDQAWFMALMREAVNGSAEADQPAPAAGDAQRPTKRPRRVVAVSQPEQLAMCIGVDDKTPCPHRKQVAAKPHIPARCPDCKLELKRRLHREEAQRLQRIRASSPPALREAI